jgi:hypothetical protein
MMKNYGLSLLMIKEERYLKMSIENMRQKRHKISVQTFALVHSTMLVEISVFNS